MSLEKILQFLVNYDIFVLIGVFGCLFVFCLVNWCKNPYRRQNRKLEMCRQRIASNPRLAGLFAVMLPDEYRRQWRAYVNGGAQRPSLVFEFVPKKRHVAFWHLFALDAAVCSAYLWAFANDVSAREYVVVQVVFWLAFALFCVVDSVLFGKKEKKARRVFGKFVAQLNALQKADSKQLAPQIEGIRKENAPVEETLQRASELLRKNGLEGNRTVQEQQQINKALNSLLQSYARKASSKT